MCPVEHRIFVLLSAQQDRRQRGRQRERVEQRDGNREGDRQRKLLVQNSRGSREKRYRHKTEISTREVAITALDTSAMAADVAVCGSVLSSLMCRWAFSMTTIASSTTSPVARVIPNSVSELMEKPKIFMKAKVPISETGIVTAGMMVARQSSRKRKSR